MARQKPKDYLVIWVVAGQGSAETQGQRRQAKTGDILTFTINQPHEYGADPHDPWEIFWFHFKGRLARGLLADLRGTAGKPFHRIGLDPDLRDRWLEAVAGHRMDDPAADLASSGRVLELMSRLLALRYRQQTKPSTVDSRLNLAEVQRYVAAHLHQPMNLADLAACAHLSESHFCRAFRQATDLSPMKYVAQQRMAQASVLLSETAQPIKQIAFAVGYDDAFYFSRHFKQIVGISPTQYRQQYREETGLVE